MNMKNKLRLYLQWNHTSFYIRSLYLRHVFSSKYYKMVSNCNYLKTDIVTKKDVSIKKNKEVKNILFTIHWFELGGAESYALETIKKAYELGYRCYIISTVPSENKEIDKFKKYSESIVDYTKIACNSEFKCFLYNYIKDNDIDVLHIHHSAITYHALPYIKTFFKELRVVDSTHIVEYENGGFPQLSAWFSDYIDIHNVISENLIKTINAIHRDEFDKNISEDKFSLTYLSSMCDIPESITPKSLDSNNEVIIGFYGRFVLQKQPFLFLDIMEKVFSKDVRNIKAIIFGDGEMKDFIINRINKSKYASRFEFIGRCDDKEKVFSKVDILVIPSINEGLTLTSYEAIANGVNVISSDVGAQCELLISDNLIKLDSCFSDKCAERIFSIIDKDNYDNSFYGCLEKLRELQKFEFNKDTLNLMYKG
ncbi:glycosyltransferase [Photobacterium leiognathi]|uniref:glycosyltransferase n=1 Tax=Photobacterium leiognathi TaxID=553611 RepID=UPI001EDF1AC6|nr:glycosyltransferase [Photobacterium leiognathi]MCG3886882.1 glycosyltransferase [Photobacterium leiognathi]